MEERGGSLGFGVCVCVCVCVCLCCGVIEATGRLAATLTFSLRESLRVEVERRGMPRGSIFLLCLLLSIVVMCVVAIFASLCILPPLCQLLLVFAICPCFFMFSISFAAGLFF